MPRFGSERTSGGLELTIHQPARLRIMAILAAIDPGEKVTFNFLKAVLRLTDGNLSTHLRALERKGYIQQEKEFAGLRPRTWIRLTARGRQAWRRYRARLETILDGGELPPDLPPGPLEEDEEALS